MRRAAILPVLALAAGTPAMAQRDSSALRPALYAEALGPGGFGSVNYEQPLVRSGGGEARLRAGIGSMRFRDFTGRLNPDLTLPVGAILTYGHKWRPELGGGVTLTSTVRPGPDDYRPWREQDLHGWLSAGLRWTPRSRGWFLRATYDPVIAFGRLRHWGGLSIGRIL